MKKIFDHRAVRWVALIALILVAQIVSVYSLANFKKASGWSIDPEQELATHLDLLKIGVGGSVAVVFVALSAWWLLKRAFNAKLDTVRRAVMGIAALALVVGFVLFTRGYWADEAYQAAAPQMLFMLCVVVAVTVGVIKLRRGARQVSRVTPGRTYSSAVGVGAVDTDRFPTASQ